MGSVRACAVCGGRYEADVVFCPRDGAPVATTVAPLGADPRLGAELPGQIRIERLIGLGSRGRVYRATQAGTGRAVAVKVLHDELVAQPAAVARFAREARAAGRLAHPNVAQVLLAGELPAACGGAPFVASELLEGMSLRAALAASGGTMPLARALHVVLQLCDAVGEAHANGVVHGDLRPENVMLVRRGDDADFVKVVDFGLGRDGDAEPAIGAHAASLLASARYVSPEGAAGAPPGPPADVYAITTMLFEALAGRTPFDGASPVAVLVAQAQEPAPGLASMPRAAETPAPLARVVAANLAKRPEDRAADARALGRALVEAARAAGIGDDEIAAPRTLVGAPHAARPSSAADGAARDSAEPAERGAPDARPSAPSAPAVPPPLESLTGTRLDPPPGDPSPLGAVPPRASTLPDPVPDATATRAASSPGWRGPIAAWTEAPGAAPRGRARLRTAAFLALCFTGGALLAGLFARRAGWIGAPRASASADARAEPVRPAPLVEPAATVVLAPTAARPAAAAPAAPSPRRAPAPVATPRAAPVAPAATEAPPHAREAVPAASAARWL